MEGRAVLNLRLRRRRLQRDSQGYARWVAVEYGREVEARGTALLLCDVWDRHWCRGAEERLARLLPRMAAVVEGARGKGVRIIHAPSDTMSFYEGSPARQRIARLARAEPAVEAPGEEPALPIDDSDGGCDTNGNPGRVDECLWSRQHEAVRIDQERDVISDDGGEILAYLRAESLEHLVILGVHANMCVLNRSFAIKRMVRWGVDVMLCRDLTDAMYNPAMPPYVSHEEGTALVVEYIEKFWCPTVASEDL